MSTTISFDCKFGSQGLHFPISITKFNSIDIIHNSISFISGYFRKHTETLQFAMLQIAEFLIEKGVDIHAKDMYHRTALHPACNRGHYDIVQMLIQHGAQVLIHSIMHFHISLISLFKLEVI